MITSPGGGLRGRRGTAASVEQLLSDGSLGGVTVSCQPTLVKGHTTMCKATTSNSVRELKPRPAMLLGGAGVAILAAGLPSVTNVSSFPDVSHWSRQCGCRKGREGRREGGRGGRGGGKGRGRGRYGEVWHSGRQARTHHWLVPGIY